MIDTPPLSVPLSDREKFLLETWRSEHAKMYTAIQTHMSANDKTLTLMITVSAVAATAVFGYNRPVVLLFYPVALMTIQMNVCRLQLEIRLLGTYRRELEAQLKSQLGVVVLAWEHTVAKELFDSNSIKAFFTLGLTFSAGVTTAGTFEAIQHIWWVIVVYLVITIVVFLTLTYLVIEYFKMPPRVAKRLRVELSLPTIQVS